MSTYSSVSGGTITKTSSVALSIVLLPAPTNMGDENSLLVSKPMNSTVEAMDGPMNSMVGAAMGVVLYVSLVDITTKECLVGGISIEGFPWG